jgi:hypothetical protein
MKQLNKRITVAGIQKVSNEILNGEHILKQFDKQNNNAIQQDD